MAANEEGGLDKSGVKCCKSSAVINGVDTDVACYGFVNRIFIILTQFKRPGTMIHIEKQDSCEGIYSSQNSVEIATDVLLGIDDPIYQVYAKKIAMMLFKETKKPILLAIALKDKEASSMPALSELLLKNKVW
eukprot:Seg1980.4 transcript_id=Seg1980.4/GoldUCD/mRNA.D3Y31 product="Proteasome assembly chaperone 3" protein_id=Seg1980.4/GoldUCD/D3Y31